MKNLVFAFALLCSTSLVAQFSFNANGTGIQSSSNTASGSDAFATGSSTTASGVGSTAMGEDTEASGFVSTAMGFFTKASGIYSTAMGWNTSASGSFSTAMGNGTIASGHSSTAMGIIATASGDYSTAMGWNTNAQDFGTTAIGTNSKIDESPNPSEFSLQNTAFIIGNGDSFSNRSNAFEVLFDGTTTIAGNVTAPAFIGDGSQLTNMPVNFNANGTGIQSSSNTASGNYSTAMGYATQAIGDYSTAMGERTEASGKYSTAMGLLTTTSGNYSTAMGLKTIAQDYASTSIGTFNLYETPNPTGFSYQNTAFVIGNGGYDSEGNYIGTDESRSNAFEVLFDGSTTIAGNVTAPAFIGDGSQLTNLPTPTVNYSDITNVPISFNVNGTGIQSSSNTASGDFSTAMGYQSEASGSRSTAMGSHTTASGDFVTTAMGYYTTASGDYSTAMGDGTTASGYTSTAMGSGATASGDYSTAMGTGTTASGNYSIAVGAGTTASGSHSTSMGGSTVASGAYSSASGGATTAEDYLSFVIGVHNKTDETPNPDSFSYQNSAFVIGNGGYDSEGNYAGTSDTFSNAFEVLFDGTTTIAGDLNINSDARLKANIISLGATLSKLLQIDGKTYTMKKDANHKKKIGLLAQDIEKVFPELVTETNDIKSVNYQGLVPVLINAMKEQQQEIDTYKKELDELKTMVKQLMSK